jgi:3-methyl-2-oxobutanoate hydroxymethyltransferase
LSTAVITKRKSVTDIAAMRGRDKIVSLTAYTAPIARLLDPHVDLLLVGDSLGMVVYGFDSTLPVTLDMMIAHGAAVVRSSERALVVVDMPFGSYQESPAQAFRSAVRILQETGATAVKLEGGEEMAETVRFLVDRGVPVLGHVGLMPQHANVEGGYKSQGRTQLQAARIKTDAAAIAEAGAFAIVLEGTMEPLSREVVERSTVPIIGIGASPACDGQVLVVDDVLGLFGAFKPRFVKRYAELADAVSEAAERYAAEVRSGAFPAIEHTFQPKVG